MKYMVTFKYSSFYEDESENKVAEDTLEYEAKDLDDLWTILGDEDYNDDIVINYDGPLELVHPYLKNVPIKDELIYPRRYSDEIAGMVSDKSCIKNNNKELKNGSNTVSYYNFNATY